MGDLDGVLQDLTADFREAIANAVTDLGVVEGALAACCTHATDENFEVRMALLELRIIRSNLAEAVR